MAWAVGPEREILAGKHASGIPDRPFADLLQQCAARVSPGKCGHRWEVLRIDAMCRDPIGAVQLPDLRLLHFSEYRDRRLQVVYAGTVNREWNLLSHAINTRLMSGAGCLRIR